MGQFILLEAGPATCNLDSTGHVFATMPDFDSIYASVRDESDLARLFQAMLRLVDELVESNDVESASVQSALKRLKVLLEANPAGSYASLCGVLWNLKFYKSAIGDEVRAHQSGRTLMSLIDELESVVKKKVRPMLMRRSVELLTNEEQLQALRGLNPGSHLELPGSD